MPSRLIPYLPAALLLCLGWARRWVCDDAFIVFRVADHVASGRGVVYNVGERVEAATCPLWMLVLAAAQALTGQVEWAAVVLGLAATGTALALAARLSPGTAPVGLLLYAALPPAWDFATSGLELGAALLVVSGAFAALASRRLSLAAVLGGLCPLARPDFGLFGLAAIGVALWRARAEGRRLLPLAGLALAPAGAWQVFRMGYFAVLTPNTALAKEASLANWEQGLRYLADLTGPYALWVPLALLIGLALVRRGGELRLERAALAVAGLLHGAYVLRVGGDFMHGRLLLPALFALAAAAPGVEFGWARATKATLGPDPAPALPEATAGHPPAGGSGTAVRRAAQWALGLGVVVWAGVSCTSLRLERGRVIRDGIADERAFYTAEAGREHPITLDDFAATASVITGRALRAEAAAGASRCGPGGALLLFADGYGSTPPTCHFLRSDLGPRLVANTWRAGLFAFAAGPDVFVVDHMGLGDPLAARLAHRNGDRIGHEKVLEPEWVLARFSEPSPADPPAVVDARAALGCGLLAELLEAVERPLSFDAFTENLSSAALFQGLRLPNLPEHARQAFCDIP